jgi:HlyD family secretion protein
MPVGLQWGWPNGTAAERAALFGAHTQYMLGFLWFLSHDERAPPRVRADMAARVEPSVADRERYGTIRGSVRDIEPVVGTSESLLRIINSPEMAQDLQRRYGGIVSAVIDLQTDPSTVTGLRWSGRGNYPQALTAGTLCEVDVVTEDVSPITLLVPWVKQVFGG